MATPASPIPTLCGSWPCGVSRSPVCPLSNLRLKVVPSMQEHPLKALMAHGLHVTFNSDDPPYFDGYVTENLLACGDALGLSAEELVHLVRNGLEAAFVTEEERQAMLARLDDCVGAHAALVPASAG
jgi:adenosine deaminase